MAVKNTPYVLDRTTGRWRKNGRFAKAPTARQLRADARGLPIDGSGKRVAASALAPARRSPTRPQKAPKPAPPKPKPKSRPKPKPRPKPQKPQKPQKPKKAQKAKKPKKAKEYAYPPLPLPVPIPPRSRRLVGRTQVVYLPDGAQLSSRQILSSTFDNARDPKNAGQVLSRVIQKRFRNTQWRADEIDFYQYGVEFVNTQPSDNPEETLAVVQKLADEFPEFTFKFSADSVHALLGSKSEGTSRENASVDLIEKAPILQEIWSYLYDLWDGDIGWFAFAENDEAGPY